MLRGRLIAVLLCLLMAVPAMPAQSSAPVMVLSEATDDVTAAYPGAGGASTAGARFDPIDLVNLEVEEAKDEFTFRLGVKDIDPAVEAFILEDSTYYVVFEHEDQPYVVQIFRAVADQLYVWGNLLRFDPARARFDFLRNVDVTAQGDTDQLVFALNREDLTDGDGAAPFPGRALDEFFVFAHLRINEQNFVNLDFLAVNGGRPDAFDRMPDVDTEGSLEIQIGIEQSGNAALTTAKPMRASNGEASTFVFTLTAHNFAAREDVFELTHTEGPSLWEITIPDSFVRIAAGGTVEIPVIVTTPFSHQHGAVESFLVELQSLTDENSVGRMELGIRYHEVPQPAGHHDEMWIHSQRFGEDTTLFVATDSLFAGNGGFNYFNTLETDEQDQAVPIKGQYWGWGFHDGVQNDPEPVTLWRWSVYLQPGLEMGLDFDLDGVGTITVPIQSAVPLVAASVEGELLHWSFDPEESEWTRMVVAHLEATEPADMAPNQVTHFGFDIHPTEDADLIEYTDRAFFGFELNLTSARPAMLTGVEAPELVAGGYIRLPLFEYSDPVDEGFAALSDLRMVVHDGQKQMGNPGETVLVTLGLRSRLAETTTFGIKVSGVNDEWVTVLGDGLVSVPPNKGRPIGLAIHIPPGTEDGEVADLIITAQAIHQPTLRSLVRVVVEADEDQDHPNDADVIVGLTQGASRDAPSIPLLAVLGALGAVFVLWRRR